MAQDSPIIHSIPVDGAQSADNGDSVHGDQLSSLLKRFNEAAEQLHLLYKDLRSHKQATYSKETFDQCFTSIKDFVSTNPELCESDVDLHEIEDRFWGECKLYEDYLGRCNNASSDVHSGGRRQAFSVRSSRSASVATTTSSARLRAQDLEIERRRLQEEAAIDEEEDEILRRKLERKKKLLYLTAKCEKAKLAADAASSRGSVMSHRSTCDKKVPVHGRSTYVNVNSQADGFARGNYSGRHNTGPDCVSLFDRAMKNETESKSQPVFREQVFDIQPRVSETAVQQEDRNVSREPKRDDRYIEQALQRLADSICQSSALPKRTISSFGGDPLCYHEFITEFDTNVTKHIADPETRLGFLIHYCEGVAKTAIKSCVIINPPSRGFDEARDILHTSFGQRFIVEQAHIKKLTGGKYIKENDSDELFALSVAMRNAEITLREWGRGSQLDSMDTLLKIFKRLPRSLQTGFRDRSFEINCRGHEVCFGDLASFVHRASLRSKSIFGKHCEQEWKPKQNNQFQPKYKGKVNTFAAEVTTTSESQTLGGANANPNSHLNAKHCVCCKSTDYHPIWKCQNFVNLSTRDRSQFVKVNKLCFNCLGLSHMSRNCNSTRSCKVCGKRHHTLIHHNRSTEDVNSAKTAATNATEMESSSAEDVGAFQASLHLDESVAANQSTSSCSDKVRLKVLPVKVWSAVSNKIYEIHAFIDGGSNSSLCTFRLLNKLGVEPNIGVCNITTVNGPVKHRSAKLSLYVQGVSEKKSVPLKHVLAIEKLPDVSSSIVTTLDCESYPHVKGIKTKQLTHTDVDLLVGADVLSAHMVEDFRTGSSGDPALIKTCLGWCFMGPDVNRDRVCNDRIQVNFERTSYHDSGLVEQFNRAFDMDFRDNYSINEGHSIEDCKALSTMKATSRKSEGHFVVGLPWKHDVVNLPNNKPLAEARLLHLKRRLEKDSSAYIKYCEKMQNYIDCGHAELVPSDSTGTIGKIWYLPHHYTKGKFRVVFDCSAMYSRTCLNDQLLAGPDLTNNLLDVLLKFRMEKYAIVGDIRNMFYQVFVPEQDRDALRFLWWENGDLNSESKEYRMCVHVFGATSSPSCAGFALRKTATENEPGVSNIAVDTVLSNIYVDDCLQSFSTVNECQKVLNELKLLLKSGGFTLTKFMSNSHDVLSKLSKEEISPCLQNYQVGDVSMSKTLGIRWNPSSDNFEFHVSIEQRPLTRRGILAMSVSQVYDPIGYIQPCVLPIRKLVQALCQIKLDWDETIPEEYATKFKHWLSTLPELSLVKMPRCYKQFNLPVRRTELHCFSDASQLVGHGAVCYLRFIDVNDNIHCCFSIGKAKVNPVKPVTVPRLELTAAVLAVKLSLQLLDCLSNYTIDAVVYWTDSTSVLSYISNEATRYKTFVANRVGFIRVHTTVDQWRHVKTEWNPADVASRGIYPDGVSNAKVWFEGPDFLKRCESTWSCVSGPGPLIMQEDDSELRKPKELLVFSSGLSNIDSIFDFNRIWTRYSSLHVLQKAIAWLLKYKQYLRLHARQQDMTTLNKQLTVEDLEIALLSIVKLVQFQSFPFVQKLATTNSRIRKSHYGGMTNTMKKLSPIFHDGILRIGGRLDRSNLPFDTKHSMILPTKHPVTDLVIRWFHEREGHSGTLHVLSAVRERFWVVKGQAAVRRVLKDCMKCRINQGKSVQQIMAPLPPFRLQSGNPAFTVVGVDFMGPLMVKFGRSQVKRYACVFSCLATRAIHIEVACSLDTSAFVNALRRFTCRRGNPQKIISDNGSNFVAAEKELKDGIRSWNQAAIKSEMLQRGVEWVFNPPYASHQGGVWERMMRSIRKIMLSLSCQRTITYDGLQTLLTEVERILNNRPIARLSDDSHDLKVLTPNSILTNRLSSDLPPDTFVFADGYRKTWRAVQWMADEFWKQWVAQYLPLLQQRQKWLHPERNMQKGDMVLLLDAGLKSSRGYWPRGIVEDTYPDKDGVVRRVRVWTGSGSFYRDVRKVCLLEGTTIVDKESPERVK